MSTLDHALMCKHSHVFNARHTAVCNELADLQRSAGSQVSMEPPVDLHDKKDKRRLDICARNGVRVVVTDVTVTSINGKSQSLPAVATILMRKKYTAAEDGHRKKIIHYNRMTHKLIGRQLEIAAFDSNGTPSAAAGKSLDRWLARAAPALTAQLVPLTKTDRRCHIVTSLLVAQAESIAATRARLAQNWMATPNVGGSRLRFG
jgi:hypothetical protein